MGLTHSCPHCGKEIGLMPNVYLCPRTRQAAPPHVPVARTTPPRPRPQDAGGPDIRELLNEVRRRKRTHDLREARELFLSP